MSKNLKVAVIGCGGISKYHLDGYKNIDGVEIYALCDINEENLKSKGAEYGVERLYTDYNEMLKLEEIDAVSVCTWNAAHKGAAIAALNAGEIAGAGLDVTDPEPPLADSPMLTMDNIILTSHIAGSQQDEFYRMSEYMRDEYLAFTSGQPTKYSVTLKMLETMA